MLDAPAKMKLLSLDDLLKLGNARVEIIDGSVVKMNAAGFIHNIVGGNIHRSTG